MPGDSSKKNSFKVAIGGVSTSFGGMEKMLMKEYMLCVEHEYDPSLVISLKSVANQMRRRLEDFKPNIIEYTPAPFLRSSFPDWMMLSKTRWIESYFKGLGKFDGFSVGISGYAYGPGLLELATEFKKPAIATVHGYLAFAESHDQALKEKYQNAFRNLRGLSAVSEDSLSSYLATYSPFLPSKLKLAVIENFVEEAFFDLGRQKILNLSSPKVGPLKIVAAGRLVQSKRFDDVLRAFQLVVAQNVGDLTLVIAGEGSELATLEKLAMDLGLQNKTQFVGHVDLVNLFSTADLFVTATEREGGASLVIAEALASGVPVCGFEAPGLTQALKACQAVKLVADRNPRVLADSILDFLSSASTWPLKNQQAFDFAANRYQKDRWARQRLEFQNLLRT